MVFWPFINKVSSELFFHINLLCCITMPKFDTNQTQWRNILLSSSFFYSLYLSLWFFQSLPPTSWCITTIIMWTTGWWLSTTIWWSMLAWLTITRLTITWSLYLVFLSFPFYYLQKKLYKLGFHTFTSTTLNKD